MLPLISWRTVWLLSTILAVMAQGRRIRLKPALSTEDPDSAQPPRQVLFYAEEPSQSEEDAPVVIARQSSYGRASNPTVAPRPRTPETPRAPPVQTIRNYNKINDDGSFTFGYEAADGSFKEETRGTDCVVRGKYGYIDPDGNKREFTYVSGNPCDPNAISQEEEDELKDKSNEEENIPNIPRRPNFVVRPAPAKRPTTTLFQQSFNNDDSGQEEDNNQLVEIRQPLRPTLRTNLREEDQQLIRTTTRPVARVTFPPSMRFATKANSEQPATTYRPQVIQLGVTPSPATVLARTTKAPYVSGSTVTPNFFDDQFKKFQLESNAIPSHGPSKPISSNPIYSTELVYDPASGQYNTIVYQQVPKFGSDVNFNQRIQPYVQPPAVPPAPTTPRLSPSGPTTPLPYFQQQQQQLIQQQQQAALVQQSQQLYNQQLRAQQQQRQLGGPLQSPLPQTVLLKQNPSRYAQPIVQRFPPDPKPLATQEHFQQGPPHPFYYINPVVPDQRQNLAAGQIEAFLRGHNLPF